MQSESQGARFAVLNVVVGEFVRFEPGVAGEGVFFELGVCGLSGGEVGFRGRKHVDVDGFDVVREMSGHC